MFALKTFVNIGQYLPKLEAKI